MQAAQLDHPEPLAQNLGVLSRVSSDGELRVWLEPGPVPEPEAGEVVVALAAVPINPSDVGSMLGPADPRALIADGTPGKPALRASVDPVRLAPMRGRLDQAVGVGLEGAGTVIAAGSGSESLLGRLVATQTVGTFARYRLARASNCLVLPEGTALRAAAAAYINPLTALGMVETLRAHGHHALVHTAAASNLGQMLLRVCQEDGIELVNIVRSERQVELLGALGATCVLNSEDPDFPLQLDDAVATTGATMAFDAVGGGELATAILASMERATPPPTPGYSRYGSGVLKELFLYGGLNSASTVLRRDYGMAWRVGGWLVFSFLQSLAVADMARLHDRVASGLTTTFASHFDEEVSLKQLLSPDVIVRYAAHATGRKFLINPTLGVE